MDFDSLVDDGQVSVAPAAPQPAQPQPPLAQPQVEQDQLTQQPLAFDALQDDSEKYGVGTQVLAGIHGVAKGLAGPIATAAERALGVQPETIETLEKVFPVTAGVGEAVGLVGPAIATLGASAAARAGLAGAARALPAIEAATKFTQAGALEKLGLSATRAIGLGGEGAGAISKIGSLAVRGAIENAAYQAGDEVSKQILHPDFSEDAAASAIVNIGGAGLIGGALGGTFGTVSQAWTKAMANHSNGILSALARKTGGIEGIVPEPVNEAIQRLGIDVPPEIVANMSNNPELRAMASALNQSDTTKSGQLFQETVKKFKSSLDDYMIEALNKDPASITSEFSQYNAGQNIGLTLANEYSKKMAPIAAKFDAAATKYGSTPIGANIAAKEIEAAGIQQGLEKELLKQKRVLDRAIKTQNVEAATQAGAVIEEIQQSIREVRNIAQTPGITDELSQKIAQLVDDNAWAGTEEIMKEVNRLQKRLPELKTVKDLSKEITTIGNNTQSTLPFGQATPLSRAGGQLREILKEAELDAVGAALGKAEGLEAAKAYQTMRGEFAQVAKLKNQLDDRLRAFGSATNYANSLREMAKTDAEAIFKRLSGRGDVDLLNLLSAHFPETATAVQQSHLDDLLAKAVKSAKAGEKINGPKLIKSIEDMASKSPELRDFLIPKDAQSKIMAANTMIDALTDTSHNFSNTARTVDKLLNYLPGSATGLATALLTHSPVAAVLVGGMTKALAKDVPDAVRLSLLKMLGSGKPIDSTALRATIDFANSVIKGQNKMIKATEAVISGAGKIVPSKSMITDKDREKIDKKAKELSANSSLLLERKDKLAHYSPDADSNLTVAAGRVANYLNSIRPEPIKTGPLDKEIEPSKQQISEYNRALDIAANPLVVLDDINKGTLLASDIRHLQAMYPEVYNQLSKQLFHSVVSYTDKGHTIPYSKRQSLSLFLGQPLDATFKPESIMAAQSTFGPEAVQPSAITASAPGQRRGQPDKLKRISTNMLTGPQAREMRGNKI